MVKKLDGDSFDSHKEKRLEHKSALLILSSALILTDKRCREHEIFESAKSEAQGKEIGFGEYVVCSLPRTL